MMQSIFEFKDYREYLKNYFEDRKRKNPRYSFQSFAEKMGFNNKAFLYNVIKGKKKLSQSHCFKLSKALGHNRKESEYFENIVAYAQAKNEDERTCFLERLEQNKNIAVIPTDLIGKDKEAYYSKWYHSAVRSLIGMYPVGDNHELIICKITPPITAAQAKNSVQLLERLGMVCKGSDGFYRLTGKNIEAGDSISKMARNRFHIECTELAKQSIIDSGSKRRYVSSLTLGISEKTYETIYEETRKFRKKIIELAHSDLKADRVYQYQIILFPLSSETMPEETGGNK